MSRKYLDETGLTYLWSKLKAYFQVKLVSGTNIKTINNMSLLGSGDITIQGGGGGGASNIVGEIKQYAGLTIPSGWLECDGSEVAVADYPLLYAAIGDLWGTPSDADHFILPDFRGKVAVGHDNSGTSPDVDFDTVGESGGDKTHLHTTGDFTLGTDHIPAHTHGSRLTNGSIRLFKGNQSTTASGSISFSSMTKRQYNDDGTSTNSWQTATFALNHTHASVGGGAAHNHGNTGNSSNLQPYAVVKYIICTA